MHIIDQQLLEINAATVFWKWLEENETRLHNSISADSQESTLLNQQLQQLFPNLGCQIDVSKTTGRHLLELTCFSVWEEEKKMASLAKAAPKLQHFAVAAYLARSGSQIPPRCEFTHKMSVLPCYGKKLQRTIYGKKIKTVCNGNINGS